MKKITNYEELLKAITYKKEDLGKSPLTSGNAYKITIKYNNKQFTFTFNDNYYNSSDLNDYIQSLKSDASCFEESRDIEDFIYNFYGDISSYKQYKEIEKSFNGCKRASKALKRLFSDDELELIYNQEY